MSANVIALGQPSSLVRTTGFGGSVPYPSEPSQNSLTVIAV
jgi:hypothetical protein